MVFFHLNLILFIRRHHKRVFPFISNIVLRLRLIWYQFTLLLQVPVSHSVYSLVQYNAIVNNAKLRSAEIDCVALTFVIILFYDKGPCKECFFPKIRDYCGSGWVGQGLTLNFFVWKNVPK